MMLKKLFNFISFFYLFIFGRAFFKPLNHLILRFVLKSLGFMNHGSLSATGEKNFIEGLKKKNIKNCVDIGAHIGDYSFMLYKTLNCKVISFEPNKNSYLELKKITKKSKNKIKPFNLAVSNKNSTSWLYYGSKKSQLASLSNSINKISYIGKSNINKVKVKTITLDSFFKKNKIINSIDLIKIDTEGYEYEVLMGAKKTINKYKPTFIQIEYNWHQLIRGTSLYKIHLLLKNYEAYRILPFGKKLSKIDSIRPEENIFHLSNIVFVKKKHEKN